MREIKFRAWILGKMWKVLALGWTEDGIIIHTDGGFMHLCEEDDVELLEYTGLKDKNGKDTYEGDILKFPDGEAIQVIWMEYPAAFSPMDLHQTSEVIGNIYENGDLLNG